MHNWRMCVLSGLATVVVGTILALATRSGPIEADLAERATAALASDGQGWGSVTVDGRDLTLHGTAPSPGYRGMGLQSVDRVWGVRVVADAADVLAAADPFVWSIEKSASGLALAGSVPPGPARERIAAILGEVAPGVPIEDGTAEANGAPELDGWLDAIGFAAARLGDLSAGRAELSGTGFSFSGMAADAAAYDAYRAALTELPAGYSLVSDTVAPPPASPYVWSAGRHGKALALTGSMPDDAARAALAGAISRAFPGFEVADGTTPASGAPEEFDVAIAMALDALSRLEDGAVTITDRELSIRGRARHFDTEPDLRAALATGLPPGFSVAELAVSPPAISPFTFSATTADGALRLAGYVPDEAARSAIRETAAGLGLAVDDRLVVAGGAPEGFLDAARAALSALAGLAPGRAELSGLALSVSGKAPNAEVFARVNAVLDTGLPAGVTLAARDIAGPPPPPAPEPAPVETPAVETPAVEATPAPAAVPDGWTMELGEAGIVLVGRVPDEAARSAIRTRVSRLFPDRAIDDRLVVADGAPQGFGAAVEAAIDAVGRLVTGRAAVLDGTIELTGEAYNERAIDEILDRLKQALPQGFTTAGGLRVAAPAAEVAATECQQLLSGLLSNNTIHFESAQSVISVESYGLLDALAFASQRCPAARIEIGGHTDADGAEDANLALSEERAAAVRDYLVRAGVAADRLDARGYGEAKPVADNATEEGKAKNRRTEFRIEQ